MQYVIRPTSKDVQHKEWKDHKYVSKKKKNGNWIYNYNIAKDTANRARKVNSPNINANRGSAAEAIVDSKRDPALSYNIKKIRNERAITNPNYNRNAPSELGRAKRSAEKELLGDAAENIRKRHATDNSIDSVARMNAKDIFNKMEKYRKMGYSSEEIINDLLDEKEAIKILSLLKGNKEGLE